MKKIIALLCCLSLLLAACGRGTPATPDGMYLAETDDPTSPYFSFCAADGTWRSSGSVAMDFSVGGTFKQRGNSITATTDDGGIVCRLEFQPDGGIELKTLSQPTGSVVSWLREGEVYRFWEPLWEAVLPADEALARAKKEGVPVTEDLRCTAGKDVWDAFTACVAQKEPNQVLSAAYYAEVRAEEEGVTPAALYLTMLYYDGARFSVQTRNSTEQSPEKEETYKYLLRFTGDAPAGALFDTYDEWILADDDTLTYEQIQHSMYSSDSADQIRFCTVFSDLR